MAGDFENLHDIDDLSDDELRVLVRDHLRAHRGIDADDITVRVRDGEVLLGGRVGTEAEARVAERVVHDGLGIQRVRNDIAVDQLRREETPEDIEEHLVVEDREAGLLLGDRPPQESDETHLHRGDEDVDERLLGTTDVQDAIAHGTTWIPPESPTPEGISGQDVPPGYGERH